MRITGGGGDTQVPTTGPAPLLRVLALSRILGKPGKAQLQAGQWQDSRSGAVLHCRTACNGLMRGLGLVRVDAGAGAVGEGLTAGVKRCDASPRHPYGRALRDLALLTQCADSRKPAHNRSSLRSPWAHEGWCGCYAWRWGLNYMHSRHNGGNGCLAAATLTRS